MTYRLVTCNTERPDTAADNESTVRTAADHGDIIHFQEANDPATVAAMRAETDFLRYIPKGTANQNPMMWRKDRLRLVTGSTTSKRLMLGGKIGLGGAGDHRRLGPNREASAMRVVELATGLQAIHVNVHLIAKSQTDARWRSPLWLASVAVLRSFLAEQKKAGLPIIVTGDFNYDPENGKPINLGAGFVHAKTPATLGGRHYDHVFTFGAVQVSNVETIRTKSDHLAVAVDVTLGVTEPTPPVVTPKPEVTVPRSVEDALAWTHNRGPIPDQNGRPVGAAGWCKRETRLAYGVPSDGSADAATAWGRTKFKHTDGSEPPRGAVCWYLGGRSGHGHVCPSAGDGMVRSTDLPTSGRWGDAKRTDPVTKWGLRYVGWSEDIDGVRVIHADAPPTPAPKPIPRRLRPEAYFIGAKGTHVTWLGKRLVLHGFGRFYKQGPGPTFTATDKKAVAAFQRAQGWTGSGADGLPGAETLKLLAKAPAKKAPAKKAARPKPKPTGTMLAKGDKVADMSFARISPAALKAAGFAAVVRYLSKTPGEKSLSGKDLTGAEVKAYAKVGLGIICVWETTAGRATEGRAAGVADVKAAEAQADALGLPADQPIFYAVDFDATASKVRPYFTAVNKAAKHPTGCYGGVKIAAADLATYVWQTEAWSHGEVSNRAHMIQRIHPTLKVKGAASGWDENDVLKPIPVWRP